MKQTVHLLLFATFLWLGCTTTKPLSQDPCLRTQAAFDIGSGSTKVKVAEVNICQRRFVKLLWENSNAIPFEEALLSTGQKKVFTEEIRERGRDNFKQMIVEAAARGATEARGVATAAFREALNGSQVIQELEQIGGQVMPTHLRVISQDTESAMGFEAGVALSGFPAETAVAWDIGGGSQEIAAQTNDPKQPIIAFKGKLASTQFMSSFPLKSSNGRQTPNPIGDSEFRKGLKRAQTEAQKTVPKIIKERLKSSETVIGLGGVMYKSVYEQVGKNPFTAADIERVLRNKLSLSDEQIGGKYANTQVTNLILVLGFMKALSIRQVFAVNADLATALLVSPNF